MTKLKILIVVSLSVLLWSSHPVNAFRPRNSFQHWFSDVEAELSGIVANKCSEEFQEYLDEQIVQYGVHCVRTFNCIVSYCTEYTKANMAAAAVLLGLTPLILTQLGSSTTELARLSARRPLLALLMVLGSPAADPIRTFDYHSPRKDLQLGIGELEVLELSDRKDRWLALFQLLCGMGCVINLGLLCVTINLYSVSVMSCDYSDILVEMWIISALVTHAFGVFTFLSRARTTYSDIKPGRATTIRWWRDWPKNEIRTCIKHKDHELDWKPENMRFIVLAWITSVFTIIHLAYGTLQFSSMFFVGTPDTLQIVGRFMLSSIVCRIIVAYELAGQKAAAKRYIPMKEETKLRLPEHDHEIPPHHSPTEEIHTSPNSDVEGSACPDDDPMTTNSNHRDSIELRPLREQEITSPEAAREVSGPPTSTKVGSSEPEEST